MKTKKITIREFSAEGVRLELDAPLVLRISEVPAHYEVVLPELHMAIEGETVDEVVGEVQRWILHYWRKYRVRPIGRATNESERHRKGFVQGVWEAKDGAS